MGSTKISVLMGVYNGQEFVKDAIQSILDQTMRDFELIVVDDGSTDRSVEVVESFSDPRIVLLRQGNKGLSAALNAGLKIAQGEYIARADADDLSLPERFRRQVEFLDANPGHVAVGSWIDWISCDGAYLYTMRFSDDPTKLRSGLPFRVPVSHGASIFRTRAMREIGGYKELGKHFRHEDLLLMIDLAEKGDFHNLQEVLVKVRLVPSSNTLRAQKHLRVHKRIVRKYYDEKIVDLKRVESLGRSRGLPAASEQMSSYYLRIGKIYLEENFDRSKAIRNLLTSIQFFPLNGRAWFNFMLSFFPKVVIRHWKDLRVAH